MATVESMGGDHNLPVAVPAAVPAGMDSAAQRIQGLARRGSNDMIADALDALFEGQFNTQTQLGSKELRPELLRALVGSEFGVAVSKMVARRGTEEAYPVVEGVVERVLSNVVVLASNARRFIYQRFAPQNTRTIEVEPSADGSDLEVTVGNAPEALTTAFLLEHMRSFVEASYAKVVSGSNEATA